MNHLELIQVRIDSLILGENLSRAGVEHSPKAVKLLAEQILENDFWDPPHAMLTHKGKHILTFGYKRWQAAKYLDEQGKLPACVSENIPHSMSIIAYPEQVDLNSECKNAAENLDRENLNTYQVARTLFELSIRHPELTPYELTKRFPYSIRSIQNYIRLARQLCPEVQEEWKRRAGTDKAFSFPLLFQWAALPPENQPAALNAYLGKPLVSKRSHARRADRRRSVEAIQTRLSHEKNKDIRKALLWVLKEDEDEHDGEYQPTHYHDGNLTPPGERDPNLTYRTHFGPNRTSGSPSNLSDYRMRKSGKR